MPRPLLSAKRLSHPPAFRQPRLAALFPRLPPGPPGGALPPPSARPAWRLSSPAFRQTPMPTPTPRSDANADARADFAVQGMS
ncbi:MAG TPA: hypothetical protein VFS00_27895, partial [Polyangiaceae bacterium]|nr:hypothetical protein [Polyangiaceae bacterium]